MVVNAPIGSNNLAQGIILHYLTWIQGKIPVKNQVATAKNLIT